MPLAQEVHMHSCNTSPFCSPTGVIIHMDYTRIPVIDFSTMISHNEICQALNKLLYRKEHKQPTMMLQAASLLHLIGTTHHIRIT